MKSRASWDPIALGGGAFTAFEKAGTGSAVPLVLLHGAGGNALTWLPIEAAFGNRRVVMVDMPAHGHSASPRSWELGDIAASVARAVTDHLGNAPAIWGGHSWGGKVAGMVAASGAAPCEGLLLVDPSPSSAVPVDNEDFVDGIWSIELRRYASPDAAADAARDLQHWQPWNETMAAAFRHGLAQHDDGSWSLRPARDQLLALAKATLHADASEDLARNARIRTLLLVAGESEMWQSITNVAVYAHATRHVIPGNHWLHLCASDAVIAAAQEWLED
jgi:pimeloyl-ACP methyl ester carboxylesterase